MIIRYLSSAGIGIAVTTALLWTMNALIDTGETVSTPRERIELPTWVRGVDDTKVKSTVVSPVRIPEPPVVPNRIPPGGPGDNNAVLVIPSGPVAPSGPKIEKGILGNIDGDLVNMVTARPDYPLAASQHGLEGYVIVSFDVTALGTIENVKVVESSSKVFDKTAIKAAYRSRYKPKTVDGISQSTEGVRKLFRFEMEN